MRGPSTPLPPTQEQGFGDNKFNGACATGVFHANVIGARRSHHSLRRLRTSARAGKRPAGGAAEDLVPDGTGNPLNKDERFLKTGCPACGKPARRETDTMDYLCRFRWYYMRYCCPMLTAAWSTSASITGCRWISISAASSMRCCTFCMRVSGPRLMRDLGLVKFDEPFTRLFTQGMLTANAFIAKMRPARRWFYPAEVEVKYDERGRPGGAIALEDGKPVMLGGIEKDVEEQKQRG